MPHSYERFFRAAAATSPDKPIRVELATASKARNLRRMLYAYRLKMTDPSLALLSATVQLRVVGRILYAASGASLETPYSTKIDEALTPHDKP